MRALLPALLIVLLGQAAGAEDPIVLSDLHEGEQLGVKFTSQGCFHGYTTVYVFTPGEVTAWELKSMWSQEEKKLLKLEPEKLGTLKLNEAVTRKLDKLFAFYAARQTGGCTTMDTIEIQLTRGDTVLETREYRDDTCATTRMNDIISLPDLRKFIQAQNPG